MSWILKEINKDEIGPPLTLQPNDNVIGRKLGTYIRLVSSFASRQHCTIKIKNDGAYLIDHNTLNGTFIGPDKIPTNREIPLRNGDCIGIGLAANEFSPEPYYQIYKIDVDPEIFEVPDTCDATVLYIPEKSVPSRTHDKDVFVIPQSGFKHPQSRYPLLPVIKCEKTSLPASERINTSMLPPVLPPRPLASIKVEKGTSSSIVCQQEIKREVSHPPERTELQRIEDISAYVIPDSPEDEIIDLDFIENDDDIRVIESRRNSVDDNITTAGSVENEANPANQAISNLNPPVPEVSNNSETMPPYQGIPNPSKSNSSVHEFSICDNDIIVIDDDEDENDLPCSQFFNSTKKELVVMIEEESLSSFRSEVDEDVLENLDDELLCDDYNLVNEDALTSHGRMDSDGVNCNEKEIPSFELPTKSRSLIHSQLSPETYLSRVNNENSTNLEVNSNLDLIEDDLLTALMTQKEKASNNDDVSPNLNDIFTDVENWLSEVDAPSDRESLTVKTNKNVQLSTEPDLNPSLKTPVINVVDEERKINKTNQALDSSIHLPISKKDVRKSLSLRTDSPLDVSRKTSNEKSFDRSLLHKDNGDNTTKSIDTLISKELPSHSNISTKQTSSKRRNKSNNQDEPKTKSPRLSKEIVLTEVLPPSSERRDASLLRNKCDSSSAERRCDTSSKSIGAVESSKNKENLTSINKNSSTTRSKMANLKDATKVLERCLKRFKKSSNTKSKKEPYNLRPSEKRKLVEKRREKLKEVAEKEKEQKNVSKTKVPQNEIETVTHEYVKNTEKNRGAILIDMIPQRSVSKRKRVSSSNEIPRDTAETMPKAIEDVTSVRRSSRKSVLEKEKVQYTFEEFKKRRNHKTKSISNVEDTSKISPPTLTSEETLKHQSDFVVINNKTNQENPPSIPLKRKSSLKSRNSTGSLKNVQFAEENRLTMVKYYEKDPVDVTRSFAGDETHKRALIPMKGGPFSNDELIYLFCKWNPRWIQESLNLSSMPPLLEGSFPHPSPTVKSYQNYSDYQNAMLPLQIFEVWETLLRDVLQQNTEPFIGVVREVYAQGVSDPKDVRKMDVISVTGFVTCGKNYLPKRGDFVIVRGVNDKPQSKPNASNNKSMWLSFGYISCQPVKKPMQHSDKSSLDSFQRLRKKYNANASSGQVFTVNFKVMVRQKITKFWKTDHEISVLVCSNIIGDLKLFSTLSKLYHSPLISLVLDPFSYHPIDKGEEYTFKQQQALNKEQMKAVNYCSEMVLGNNPSIALIHGPPGTGKSVAISHILMTVLDQVKKDKQKVRLLLCAPSNFAVDQLVSRLLNIRKKMIKNKFNMVRVGKYEMMSDDGKNISLKTLADKMLKTFSVPDTAKQEIDRLGKREKYLLSLKESGCENDKKIAEEINNNRRYVRELHLLSQNKADQMVKLNLLRRFEKNLLINADIVATTLSSSVSLPIQEAFTKRDSSPFGCCIIDEASQATELQTLTPILLDVNKFILVGDHKQLSPVITNQKAKADGLEVSLFERLLTSWENQSAPIFPLVRQYRMHREIAKFPNKTFYKDKLITERSHHHTTHLRPYLIFNHSFNQLPNKDMNVDEGNLVIKLIQFISGRDELKAMSKAIITPYQSQREFLKTQLNSTLSKDVSVMTVDSAQGQERDIIILSCVKTNSVGFLGDANRLNVALTRAKHCLFIVANFKSLQDNQLWNNLLADSRSRKCIIDISSLPSESSIKRYIYV